MGERKRESEGGREVSGPGKRKRMKTRGWRFRSVRKRKNKRVK